MSAAPVCRFQHEIAVVATTPEYDWADVACDAIEHPSNGLRFPETES